MKRLFNLNSSKKSLSLALLIASFTVASSGSIVAHAGSQDADVPPVGQEWIKVKIPLKMGYYSTAESKHKVISSAQYKVENLSDYPVEVDYNGQGGFVGKDGSSEPITTGVQELTMDLSDGFKYPLVTKGQPVHSTKGYVYKLGARSGTPISGNFKAPSSNTIRFSGATQSNINPSQLITQENKLNFELSLLDPNGQIPKDQTAITVRDSNIVFGTAWSPDQNYVSGTDDMGNSLPLSKVTVGGDKVDTSKPGTSYKVTYSYRNVTQTATVNINDLTSFNVHDSTIKIGDTWNARDNFDGGKDEFGQPLDISKVTIGGDKVDTNSPGAYKVTYTYRNITKTANVVVNGNLTFMNQVWDIIKGPGQLGAGNYLIASQKSISSSVFNSSTYFINDTALDGYQDSKVKPIVDKWYTDNIKGTVYENYVQPVSVSNPKLSDMKTLGWTSSTVGDSLQGFLTVNQPNAYPTTVNSSGVKQAFLMSGSDVSNGKGKYGDLTPSAIKHKDVLRSNGIQYSWLRSPGKAFNHAGILSEGLNFVAYAPVDGSKDIVPSMIIHVGDSKIQVKDSTIDPNTSWKPADNFVSGTDESGNSLDISKVTIGGDKVDTSKPGDYNVTYSYGNATQTAKVTVKDYTSITVHDSQIECGSAWTPAANFDGGKDQFGNPLTLDKVTIGGDKVDTSKPGTSYKVTYSYGNVTQTATVTTSNPYKPVLNSDGTITFAGQKWSVIKGPDKMGTNNYLISLQKSIGNSKFVLTTYYTSNTDTADGYKSSPAKSVVDTWYNANIQNTYYNDFVQPVVLSNPTLGDMKKLGWKSNTDTGGDSQNAWLSISQPEAYPTVVDNTKGFKQAFLMSTSDLSSGAKGAEGTMLSESALKYRDILKTNSVNLWYVRSPGSLAARVSNGIDSMNYFTQAGSGANYAVVPSLVINIP